MNNRIDDKSRKMMNLEINNKIEEILRELDLIESNDPIIQLKNCSIIQKYIVDNNTNLPNIMDDREDLTEEDIQLLDSYQGLIENIGTNMSNAQAFKRITERVGVESEILISQNKVSKKMEASNLVKFGEKYYIFDSTLERQLYDDYRDERDFHLCAAGLGKEYFEFFQPFELLPNVGSGYPNPIPYNIAETRIEPQAIDSLVKDTEVGLSK